MKPPAPIAETANFVCIGGLSEQKGQMALLDAP